MSNVSDKRCIEISKLYQEKGLEKTAEILGVKTSTIERQIREAKQRNLYQDVNQTKSKYINQIIDNYSDTELKLLANGKSLLLEKSKKLNINFEGKSVKIGVLTDTHIGHKMFYEERLYAAFSEFHKQKIDFMCHCGDVTEGRSHRPGHI